MCHGERGNCCWRGAALFLLGGDEVEDGLGAEDEVFGGDHVVGLDVDLIGELL